MSGKEVYIDLRDEQRAWSSDKSPYSTQFNVVTIKNTNVSMQGQA